MRRREFIGWLSGAVTACPLALRAQQPDWLRRIGVLMAGADDPLGRSRLGAFREGLQQLHWIVGHNLQSPSGIFLNRQNRL
jgi:putative ABC transport system substrate-binding protein